MLEPDWLDFNKDNSQDILFGQQFDSAGRLMGYWIRDSHPGHVKLVKQLNQQGSVAVARGIPLSAYTF